MKKMRILGLVSGVVMIGSTVGARMPVTGRASLCPYIYCVDNGPEYGYVCNFTPIPLDCYAWGDDTSWNCIQYSCN